ncbi:hypothetical protein KY538_004434 [Salmonella enterica]|nr:hypothetical protein [Salmonella enterica]
MKELTNVQLATVSGANLGACSAAYWGMNGGKAGGGFIGSTGAAAGSAIAWYALGCDKMDLEKIKNYNPASDTSANEVFIPNRTGINL